MSRAVYGDGDDCVYIDHEGVEYKSDGATLFNIHGEKKWIPKSIIVDEGDEVVVVKKWWAKKEGIEGDW